MWKVSLAGVLLASTALLGAAATTSRTHIAFVSLQRVAAQSAIGQNSAKRLEAARQEKSKALAEKQQKVEALRLQIAQNGGILYRSKREELRKQEEKERTEFERLKETSQSDIQTLQREIQTAFQADLRTVLAELASQHDADVVLNADTAVMWAKPGFDLTEEALKHVDALEAGRAAARGNK
jgi:Skp family chaperone for outer membrane proteins